MAASQPVPLAPGLIAGRHFVWGSRTFLMGIINCTDDSFSGDGLHANTQAALRQGLRMVQEGADILDLGAESTRPGFQPVSEQDELARVVPVIAQLVREVNVPLSIDSTKAAVVRAALDAGATIVNDVNGLRGEPDVARAASQARASVVMMHNQRNRPFRDVIGDIRDGLLAGCAQAEAAGIPTERLIMDPGFGFGWRPQQSIEMLRRLGELRDMARPLLVGTSRKSTIGAVLDLPVQDRLEGTAATVALAIANGADIVRVHDVREMSRVARMADAVVRGWQPPVSDAILLGLGSNLGDRLANLRRGVELLGPEVRVQQLSALYESAPWGVTDQPAFLNAALRVETHLSPHDLLAKCKAVEATVGREPGPRWGPRILDIDLLLYRDLRLDEETLTIPHPRIAQRSFVLRP
ncbi:MAG: Dihydropteroate synthase/7,8-dihydro-6-hydroxymethylpterin-pyrophosphokinase, partial [Chloroflexi bacterium]